MRAARLGIAVFAAAAIAWLGVALYGYAASHTARRHHVEAAWYIVAIATLGLAAVPRRGEGPGANDPAAPPVAAAQPIAATPHLAWIAAAAVVASAALYWRAVPLGLLSDDHVLVQLPVLPGDRWEYLRPLPMLLWAIVHPIAGAPALHALNIVLHGINAALLCALALETVPAGRLGSGVLAAAVFLVSPLAVEPVAWAAGVFDTALVTCALAYLLVLVRVQAPARATVLALLCVSAALATKEAAVALPVLGALLAIRRRVAWIAISASAALCAIYALIRASDGGVPLGDGSWRYLAKELLGRPFGALGEPWTTADVSAMPLLLGVVVPIGFAVLIAGHAAGRYGSWRSLSSAAWVVAGAAPVLAYFFVAPDLSGSRYAYLPLVGWSILVAEAAQRQGSAIAGRVATAWVLCLLVLWGVGGQRRLDAYVEAAALRDRVFASATRVVGATACETVVLADAPSVHAGAYVWRNGLPEAMAAATGRQVTTQADRVVPVGCAFVWRGSAFVPRPGS